MTTPLPSAKAMEIAEKIVVLATKNSGDTRVTGDSTIIDLSALAIDAAIDAAVLEARADAQREIVERAGDFKIERVTPIGPVQLWIDQQGFTIDCPPDESDWYARMLGIALTALGQRRIDAALRAQKETT